MNESHTPIRWNNILAAVERTEAYKPIFPFISGAPDGERDGGPPLARRCAAKALCEPGAAAGVMQPGIVGGDDGGEPMITLL